MQELGFIFGIIGMSMGITSFVFAIVSMGKINKLEEKLKQQNVL